MPDLADVTRSLIAAAGHLEPEADPWQPIETAPMDTDVLVWRIDKFGDSLPPIVAGCFHNGEEAGWSAFDSMNTWIEGKATRWMRLPRPPKDLRP